MKGVECEGALDLHEAFGLMQGLGTSVLAAYTQGEQSNGDPVYSVQPFNLIWTLSYNNPEGKWGANVFTSYTSGKENNDSYQSVADGSRTYPLYLSNTATIIRSEARRGGKEGKVRGAPRHDEKKQLRVA